MKGFIERFITIAGVIVVGFAALLILGYFVVPAGLPFLGLTFLWVILSFVWLLYVDSKGWSK